MPNLKTMKVTPELIKKYTQGDCSAEEIVLIENWMANTDTNELSLEGVPFSDALDERLRKKIRRQTFNNFPARKKTNNKIAVWLAAASVALLLGISSFLYMNRSGSMNYETAAGELKTVMLADGSTITLNAMSRLTAPKKFDKNSRTVQLQGEAFFEVAKDGLHPFVVETTSSKTKVLGTQFNLTAYENEKVALTLVEGKVHFSKLGQEKDGLVLYPNQQVVLEEDKLIKQAVNHTFSKAWMQKKLVFKSVPFAEVCKEIERFYGISIIIQNKKLHNRLYRGSHKNPGLADLMQKMSFVLQFKYKIQGRTLIIY